MVSSDINVLIYTIVHMYYVYTDKLKIGRDNTHGKRLRRARKNHFSIVNTLSDASNSGVFIPSALLVSYL